jgi:hypothetical protein
MTLQEIQISAQASCHNIPYIHHGYCDRGDPRSFVVSAGKGLFNLVIDFPARRVEQDEPQTPKRLAGLL